MTYFVMVVGGLLVVVYSLYVHFASVRWDERERCELERLEMRVVNVMTLLEANDVRAMMTRPASRRFLFLQYSEAIRQDILEMVGRFGAGFASVGLLGVFFLAYYTLRFKSRVFCDIRDLHFLTGLELTVLRLRTTPS
jgi:hypothetical protein